MKKYYVVSAVGRDRPGLINEVAHAVHALGGNIELQRSTRMASEFALLMLFSCPADASADDAVGKLEALRRDDFFVAARAALSEVADRPEGAQELEMIASGADQPGLLDAATLLLVQSGLNIESMDYDVEGAPMTGEPLFRLHAKLAGPPGFDTKALREKLRTLEDEFNFDILLR